MDPQIGSLIIFGASAGTSAGLAKPAGELLKSLLERFLGPSADLAGDGLRGFFVRRRQRAESVLQEAVQMLDEANLKPSAVPGRILMPLLEAASLEEEPELSQKWAALLANAASGNSSVLPGYIDILRQLTPIHARILNYMKPRNQNQEIEKLRNGKTDDEIKESGLGVNYTIYELLANDLHRLQLIEPMSIISNNRIEGGYGRIRITELGKRFIETCQAPGDA
jgi:hypothetical protein